MKYLHKLETEQTRDITTLYDVNGRPTNFVDGAKGLRTRISIDVQWTSNEDEVSKKVKDLLQMTHSLYELFSEHERAENQNGE